MNKIYTHQSFVQFHLRCQSSLKIVLCNVIVGTYCLVIRINSLECFPRGGVDKVPVDKGLMWHPNLHVIDIQVDLNSENITCKAAETLQYHSHHLIILTRSVVSTTQSLN